MRSQIGVCAAEAAAYWCMDGSKAYRKYTARGIVLIADGQQAKRGRRRMQASRVATPMHQQNIQQSPNIQYLPTITTIVEYPTAHKFFFVQIAHECDSFFAVQSAYIKYQL